MDPSTAYMYTYQPRQRSPSAASSRSSGAYQNSSAFSASANPDEDWTKISDLAERRRIQNRIAQRNYRKKLKRRLEDLERRTTSSSTSPEQSHRELVKVTSNESTISEHQRMQRRVSVPRVGMVSHQQQYSTGLSSLDDSWMNQTSTTKPTFSYSAPPAYSFPEAYHPSQEFFSEDFQSTTFPRVPIMYGQSACSPNYTQSVSPSLPSMLTSEGYKGDQQYQSTELLTPFNLNYASLAGFQVPTIHESSDFTSRTPPWTASTIHFASPHGSPPQFAHPLTPQSRSSSPNIIIFEDIEV